MDQKIVEYDRLINGIEERIRDIGRRRRIRKNLSTTDTGRSDLRWQRCRSGYNSVESCHRDDELTNCTTVQQMHPTGYVNVNVPELVKMVMPSVLELMKEHLVEWRNKIFNEVHTTLARSAIPSTSRCDCGAILDKVRKLEAKMVSFEL